MHRILRQIVIQIRLALKLQYKSMRQSLVEFFPAAILACSRSIPAIYSIQSDKLTSLHALHVRLLGVWLDTFRFQRHENIKVLLKVTPCYVGLVLEKHNVCDYFSHGGSICIFGST